MQKEINEKTHDDKFSWNKSNNTKDVVQKTT